MKFLKYHALGNDYLVRARTESFRKLSVEEIQHICHRNFGFGSDGILLEAIPKTKANFALRIFNPDGSEAEKSGNGLRIFARYLFDHKLVAQNEPFTIETLGGTVRCQIHCPHEKIEVSMGQASFINQGKRQIKMGINDKLYAYHGVSIGNPHCVIIHPDPSEKLIKNIGPLIENNPIFLNRTNVQVMKVIDPRNIAIEIWERGAGYTLASGSSACATAFVAYKTGKCGNDITVHMPGGVINIEIDDNDDVIMTGPTTFIGELTVALLH